jgi:integrase
MPASSRRSAWSIASNRSPNIFPTKASTISPRRSASRIRARRRKDIVDDTIRRELDALISALHIDKANQRLDFVPTVWSLTPPPAHERFFTRSEVAMVLNAVRHGYQCEKRKHLVIFTVVAIYLGARNSHMLKLRWSDVNLVDGWVMWPQSNSKKAAPRRSSRPGSRDHDPSQNIPPPAGTLFPRSVCRDSRTETLSDRII